MLLSRNTPAIRLPNPPTQHNRGNIIISLSSFVQWLGEVAESLGVQIFPGFGASEVLYDKGSVAGVATPDTGIAKDHTKKPEFRRGTEVRGKITLFAEGARGSLSRQLIRKFDLMRDAPSVQSYSIGLKELWRLPDATHRRGQVVHTIGWPGGNSTWAGSFEYHMHNNLLALGYVVGLDYANPNIDPYAQFQEWKRHRRVQKLLHGGECLQFGARVLTEGGYQAIPKLYFPGGALIGCSAGFVNVAKIKGAHTAMKSGMLAAEAAFAALQTGAAHGVELLSYDGAVRSSWITKELKEVRNMRPAFRKAGLLPFMAYSAADAYLLRGHAPFTLRSRQEDHTTTKPLWKCSAKEYSAPDNVTTFDKATSVARSGTSHEEDQPPHLVVADEKVPVEVNFKRYGGIDVKFCPAGVYEYQSVAGGGVRHVINAANCVHCKTCDVKDPTQNITWTMPQGQGGPAYTDM
eukprot:TRINITY_DN2824_c0_g1_i1.p1 TRINITY_DN2824_c0_g1~~TRINITY_DN2824_c0_g1_i1.p1  ORF type:complete len:462 (-),score=86.19 TRINITY_DN2824_c0_g1_i1:176-1561(-)